MADTGLSHPELVRRYEHLTRLCWERAWEIGVTSSTRSRTTQEQLYAAWRAGTYKVPSVANPNTDHGMCPDDPRLTVNGQRWRITGSYHMVQPDGYSHALDLHWRGPSPSEFEQLANLVGLQLCVPGENWHFQWWNRTVTFPAPLLDLPAPVGPPPPSTEDDMAALIKADDGTDTIYITDYVTKRHVVDGNEYQFLRQQPGVVEQLDGNPLVLQATWVDGIPTVGSDPRHP